MTIKRIVDGKELEIVLTSDEIREAHKECVIAFMIDVFLGDFDVEDEDNARSLAEMAYNRYCEGDGLTEYECCENIYDKYNGQDEDNDDN